jgi:replicative DNA helicase
MNAQPVSILTPKVSTLKTKSDSSLPCSIEAEEAVLGGLAIDPFAYDRVSGILKPEYFYLKAHAAVFEAMGRIVAKDQQIEMTSLAIELMDEARVPSPSLLIGNLLDYSVSTVNIEYYANVVLEKWMLRGIITTCLETIQLAHQRDSSADSCRNEIEQRLTQLICRSDHAEHGKSLTDVMIQTYAKWEEDAKQGITPGVHSGFTELTRQLNGGFRRGDLVIVAGRPSMGKSALANNLLMSAALFTNRPSLMFSLEMSEEQIVGRFWAESVKEPWRLKDPTKIDWEDLGQAVSRLAGIPVYIKDAPGITIEQVRTTCRQFKIKCGDIGVIVIDYLQIMGGIDDSNPAQAIGKVTKGLKNLARELNCPIILLSQLSRGVESRSNKRPLMSDLKDSGSIEQDADVILMLYRDDYYNKNSPDRGIAEVDVIKHRNGPTGIVKLIFDGYRSRFYSLEQTQNFQGGDDDF